MNIKTLKLLVKPFLIVYFLVCVFSFKAISQQENTDKIFITSVGFGYKAGSYNSIGFSSALSYKRKTAVELNLFQGTITEIDMGIPVYLNKSVNQFYLRPAYTYYRKGSMDSYLLKINALKLGLGYKALLYKSFYLDTRFSVTKYLNENYTSKSFDNNETYHYWEMYFAELAVFVGYNFSNGSLFKRK